MARDELAVRRERAEAARAAQEAHDRLHTWSLVNAPVPERDTRIPDAEVEVGLARVAELRAQAVAIRDRQAQSKGGAS